MSQKVWLSIYLAVGIWCLTIVVLANGYTSTLTSYLTVPKLQPIVNSLSELAYHREMKMTVDFDSYLSKLFMVLCITTANIYD